MRPSIPRRAPAAVAATLILSTLAGCTAHRATGLSSTPRATPSAAPSHSATNLPRPPKPPAVSAPSPAPVLQVTADAQVAVDYASAHGMDSGIAVLDTSTNAIHLAGRATEMFASVSVAKTMIAARLLLTGQMNGSTQSLAASMIRRSDNAAAWTLYPHVGRDRLLPWIAGHYGIADLGAPPTMPGVWGSTQITAKGLVEFYGAVRHDRKVWPWLSTQMHGYAQRSVTGEPNAFGIAAAAPAAAVKNGWATNRDVKHPTNAIVNSSGFVDGDRYAVAILSEGPGSLYFAAGEDIVTHEARSLLPDGHVRVGPVRRSPPCSGATCQAPLVVLDPGHNGGNASHAATINTLVPAGYGRMKPCNTTGADTGAGYAEHQFTFDVALRVRKLLIAAGVRVILTRADDAGVGPCVDKRAAIESTPGVVAAVAIHADGAVPSGQGFHVCEDSRRPEGASATAVTRSHELSSYVHDALADGSGLVPSTYLGNNGYFYRDDLAGLNLVTNPTTFLELGNMRNSHDAALQSSPAGRQRIAAAIAHGILAYLKALGR